VQDDEFLNTPAAVKLTQLSANTLTELRLKGNGRRRVVYARSALLSWVTARERSSPSEYTGRAA
jgi:hypothetical protein